MKIVTRFAPSPTGFLTLGNYRTALFCYIFAKQHDGKFILRIEDTDKERSKKEYEESILKDLEWLSMDYDSLYRQSERTEIYKKYLQKMIDSGNAYVSKETEGKSKEVIRFKNPNKEITFKDTVRGDITFDTTELGDFIIAKSLEEPLYHLTVVVDDFDMGITHIIRGEDGISNTPRQILIQEAIGASRPEYVHLPLILAPDKTKLSKRNGSKSILDCKNEGYLPQAVINTLILLGWNPGTDQEIFSLDEIVKQFDLKKVQKANAVFNQEKLNWINKQHLLSDGKGLVKNIISQTFENLDVLQQEKISEIILERIETLKDIEKMVRGGELDWVLKEPKLEKENLTWKGSQNYSESAKHLEEILKILQSIPDNNFNSVSIKESIWDYASQNGRGDVLWPMRYALSGMEKSPDPFVLSEVLGKEKVIQRIQKAEEILSN